MTSKTIFASTLTFALVAMTMAPLAQAHEEQEPECNPGAIMDFVDCTRDEANAFLAKLISGGVDQAIFVFCAEYELIFGEEPMICYCWNISGGPICHAETRSG